MLFSVHVYSRLSVIFNLLIFTLNICIADVLCDVYKAKSCTHGLVTALKSL